MGTCQQLAKLNIQSLNVAGVLYYSTRTTCCSVTTIELC